MFAKTLVVALLVALAVADMESVDPRVAIDAVSNSTDELMVDSEMVIEEIVITLIGKPADDASNETDSTSGLDAYNSTGASNSTEDSLFIIETITITRDDTAANSTDGQAAYPEDADIEDADEEGSDLDDSWDSEGNEVASRLKRESDNATGNSTAVAACKANNVCYSSSECGEKGHCLGLFVGKCNCDACLNFLTCSDDSACGGLQHACNATQSRCNCIEGHKANGFPIFIDALRELCNVKQCDASTDTCFGLPCRSGRCVC